MEKRGPSSSRGARGCGRKWGRSWRLGLVPRDPERLKHSRRLMLLYLSIFRETARFI